MKLNRSALRKIILNEIKTLQEEKSYGDLVATVTVPIPQKDLLFFKNRKAAGKNEQPTELAVDYKFKDGKAVIQKVKDKKGNLYTDDLFYNQIFKGRKPLGKEFIDYIKDAVIDHVPGRFKNVKLTKEDVKFKSGF